MRGPDTVTLALSLLSGVTVTVPAGSAAKLTLYVWFLRTGIAVSPSYTITRVCVRVSAASSSATVTGRDLALVTSWYPSILWLTEVMPVAPSSSSTPVTVTVAP